MSWCQRRHPLDEEPLSSDSGLPALEHLALGPEPGEDSIAPAHVLHGQSSPREEEAHLSFRHEGVIGNGEIARSPAEHGIASHGDYRFRTSVGTDDTDGNQGTVGSRHGVRLHTTALGRRGLQQESAMAPLC